MIRRVPSGVRLSVRLAEERPVLLPQLRRVRWAVRATLVLGVAASVVANVLHAQDNPISQAIAAWPPLALLLTVELISRVPVHRRSLAFARLFATATIAGIAAWVSYWHMAGVAARYGETGASPYLLPLSVDGLIVVASICLVELGGRISSLEPAAIATTNAAPALTPVPAVAAAGGPAVAGVRRNRATAAALAEVAAALPRTGLPKTRGAEVSAFAPTLTRQAARAAVPAQPTKAATAAAKGRAPAKAAAKPAQRTRRTPAETIKTAVEIKSRRPKITDAELAAELGISVSRWRTIRREAGHGDDLRLAA
ncbi:hypothetical protein Adi01nite_65120 [Amorphoplanes digitatis]|nr:hypothetical protein GCM10020092_020190 [Actinoplanes digitatis]GID97100.1 hypothetical protein Adi01nite_65120 [Actinoplanes digitatis]